MASFVKPQPTGVGFLFNVIKFYVIYSTAKQEYFLKEMYRYEVIITSVGLN